MEPYDIVCFGDQWDEWKNRRQKLMETLVQLGRARKVLYVERPLTLLSFLKSVLGRADAVTAARWTRVRQRGRLLELGRIHVWTPFHLLPILPWRWLRRLQQAASFRLDGRAIGRLMRRQGMKSPVLWITHPFGTSSWVGRFGEGLVCYDTNEDYAAFPDLPAATRRWIREEDRRLTAAAHQVYVSTAVMSRRKRIEHSATFHVPNGVDLSIFRRDEGDGSDLIPDDVRMIPRPRIGFIGRITPRSNFELMLPVLQKHPEWSFVLVGAVSPGVTEMASLRKSPLTHFLGPRPYDELPRYLAAFDVCVALYRDEDLNKTGSCTKLYLYLASGKPIVTTPVPEAVDFRRLVRIAPETAEGLGAALEAALASDPPGLSEERRRVARENSWEARARLIDQHITGALRRCKKNSFVGPAYDLPGRRIFHTFSAGG